MRRYQSSRRMCDGVANPGIMIGGEGIILATPSHNGSYWLRSSRRNFGSNLLISATGAKTSIATLAISKTC